MPHLYHIESKIDSEVKVFTRTKHPTKTSAINKNIC